MWMIELQERGYHSPIWKVKMELNATGASLLGFLRRGDASGYELVARIEASIGYFWNLTRSQVYRELRTLEEASLIRVRRTEARDKRVFALTPAGRTAFRRWLEAAPGEEIIRAPLLLTVFFGNELPPAKLREVLSDHRARHARRLETFERMLAAEEGDDPYPALTLDFGVRYERACLEWFDSFTVRDDGVIARRRSGKTR
jgi:DNA-binding PadR family transcriptional regulator